MEFLTCNKKHAGPLAPGCQQCITGHKSVIFITGICHYNCFYCPISQDKRNKDLVKVNERIIKQPDGPQGLQELFEEIRLCQSTGASLTGGDPLAKLERTIRYIRALKAEFGPDFHLHLYASLPFVTQENLLALQQAGLDELRFHADLEDIHSWEKMLLAQDLTIDVGVEIPAIPGMKEKTKELIHFCKESECISFINLNELEYSDSGQDQLTKKGFKVKDLLSYGITNSEALAEELVTFGKKIDFPVHYCSASFKDKIQLGNRLRLRAQSIQQPFDIVDEQGMITRAYITPKGRDLSLEDIQKQLQKAYDIPAELIRISSFRILIAAWVLEEIAPELKKQSQTYPWVDKVSFEKKTFYPTADEFVVEQETL